MGSRQRAGDTGQWAVAAGAPRHGHSADTRGQGAESREVIGSREQAENGKRAEGTEQWAAGSEH